MITFPFTLFAAKSEPAAFSVEVGTLIPYVGTSAPTGYLLCDEQAVNRTTYSALFAIIGTTFGVGDGSTTFNLPDTKSRALIGNGTGGGLTARSVADVGGFETHLLTEAEMASHTHIEKAINGSVYPSSTSRYQLYSPTTTIGITSSTGSNTSHNNMQPFGVASMIIVF